MATDMLLHAARRLLAFLADNSGAVRARIVGGVVVALAGVSLASIAQQQADFTSAWEGREYRAYYDVGGVLTVCDGHTGGDIKLGKTYTDAECDALFWADLARVVDLPFSKCLAPPAPIPPDTLIAIRDFAYNVGGGAACASTMMRLLNAGRTYDACQQLPRWVYVKGVMVRGLQNRRISGGGGRISERDLCLAGLTQ